MPSPAGAAPPAPRILALWCPDWPVVAASSVAGIPRHRPVAVLRANRVVACSSVARGQGVRRGLRGREAQARCPELAVLPDDPERDARVFERVVLAVEELAPGVEVVRPGLVAMLAKGAAGYFGGVHAAAERLIDQVAERAGVECQVGVADGLFAATLAAHRGLVVEPGRSAEFLGPLEVGELDREPGVDRSELVDLLRRLGLRSLGAFATLPATDVASRFGADAVHAHRLASGNEPRLPARRRPPEELAVAMALDPPVVRVDAAAFAARALADRLHTLLAGHGLACTRLGIQARTVDGRELVRTWRCAEPLTPAGVVDRVRWQLDAWLTRQLLANAASGAPPSAAVGASSDAAPGAAVGASSGVAMTGDGLCSLRLVGEEVITAGELQLGLWGDVGAADERAGRALVRVQAMLGPERVCTSVLVGGRDPVERVRLVPWGERRPPDPRGAVRPGEPEPPWPGRLPAPSPSTVLPTPAPAEVLDVEGRPVLVTEREVLSAPPAVVSAGGAGRQPVRDWAGPWPVDQRWWDLDAGWRGAWLQVVLDGESAFLLLCRDRDWYVIGGYN